jgi:hypothetical protein
MDSQYSDGRHLPDAAPRSRRETVGAGNSSGTTVPTRRVRAVASGIGFLERVTPSLTLLVLALISAGELRGQTPTTASIRGQVRTAGRPTTGSAEVTVFDQATGRRSIAAVVDGWFAVPGLEVDRPYTIVVRQLGYRPAAERGVVLALGQDLRLDFTLVPVVERLDTTWIVSRVTPLNATGSGIGGRISSASLKRLPSLDRDVYDFLRLVPEISARSSRGGVSAGGVSTRFNNFHIDGISDRGLLGNFAAGTGQGAKAISIEAVREYQVLLSPFDVRFGDFAGGAINAVTRSGTNSFEGSLFGFRRTDEMARDVAPYERSQFGFVASGPIVRDRAHFFAAAEAQRLRAPARGPFIDASASAAPVPVKSPDLARFSDLLTGYGLTPGSAGRVDVQNPLRNAFGRLDLDLHELRSRIVVWHNYASADNSTFSRETSSSFFTRGAVTFPLSTLEVTSRATKNVTAAQVYTSLPNGMSNEFFVARKSQPNEAVPRVRAPLISVAVDRAGAPGVAFVEAGSAEPGHGVATQQFSLEASDNVTRTFGMHALSIGARVERFRVGSEGQPGGYGSWLFSSLDSLARGEAEQFRLVRRLLPAPASEGTQYGIHAGGKVYLGERLTIDAGARGDVLFIAGQPRYNRLVDSIYGRRTSDRANHRVEWSPRLGFTWTADRSGASQLRGGVGLFTGRPPIPWLAQRFISDGSGVGTLVCGRRGGNTDAPRPFVADYRDQPTSCATGRGLTTDPGGAVNLVDSRLRLARTMRAALGYDRRIAGDVVATVEGLYTKNLSDFLFVNVNLADTLSPAGSETIDRNGRVMYGAIDSGGIARAHLVSRTFSEVVDLRNQSRNSSQQVSIRLTQPTTNRFGWSAAYAFSRVRDVQTPPSQFSAYENWQSGRTVSGRHDDIAATRSAFDVPHRVILTATYTAGRNRSTTLVSFYYIGESGLPFTYLASAGPQRGDLNADGSNLNDPVYVPRSAADTMEIRFAGTPDQVAMQQAALEGFIRRTRCLDRQRGRIMARNSCRAPWSNTTSASLRQSVPAFRGHALSFELDVFNFLNLLNRDWGQVELVPSGANVGLLEHVSQTAGTARTSQSVFRFDPKAAGFSSANVESSFQLQIGLRYGF